MIPQTLSDKTDLSGKTNETGGEKVEKKKLVKNVRFDFINNMGIGSVHIEADCETIEDFREALNFAEEASKIMPPSELTHNTP